MNISPSSLWNHFLQDTLFRNSIYLMATTGVMGVLGFFFWGVCTHLFTPDEVGLGTALISAMGLISPISLLGFNNTFVRFLPNSEDRNTEINTGSLLVAATSAIIAGGYLLIVPEVTPSLGILQANPWYALGFVAVVVVASLNSITDSIFIAYRSAHFNLLTDGFINSITKLLLPAFFVGLGAYGIFAASGAAAIAGMIASALILFLKFGYRPRISFHIPFLKKVFHYSFTNYAANLISIAPTLVLPILIINYLGAAAAGYYYLASMVANLLNSVSGSVSQSLFAEGSYNDAKLRALLKRSTVILVSITVPAVAVLSIFGPLVLLFFGESYSAGGAAAIVILALGAPAVAAFNLGSVLLRIRHQTYSLLVSNFAYALSIIGLTYLWIGNGLSGVAMAWVGGNVLAALLAFAGIFIYRSNPTPSPAE